MTLASYQPKPIKVVLVLSTLNAENNNIIQVELTYNKATSHNSLHIHIWSLAS